MSLGFPLPDHTLLLTVAGSRAYGTHREDSDVDLKGAAIPPKEVLLGLGRPFEQADDEASIAAFRPLLPPEERRAADAQGLEGTVYDLRKLLHLALQANPNILDVLFCREAEVRACTPLGARLREARDAFVSVKARHTFAGYAEAQLRRIKNHRAWLLDPPKAEPTRADFDLPEVAVVPKPQRDAAEAAIRKQLDAWDLDLESLDPAERVALRAHIAAALTDIAAASGYPGAATDPPEDVTWFAAARAIGMDDNLIEALRRERAFRSARSHFAQYEHWLAHRNPERAALEAQYGYDTKHGAHLVRLLRMGAEILDTGRVHVWRGPSPDGPADAEELLAIRGGAWSYERLVAWAEAQNQALERRVQEGRVAEPAAPDRARIQALCVDLYAQALGA